MKTRTMINKESSKAILLSGAAWAALSFCTLATATAQDGADLDQVAEDVDDEFTLNEVIVTARNREESLQDVPLSITVFGEEDFTRRNIENLDDIARLTAGFSFEDFSGGFETPIIRGQAQTRLTALESNVSSFLDGVYLPRQWTVDVGTASLSRVEVVKGPQSARYGRNAFSGAINFIPFKATLSDELISGQVGGTVGSDERYDGSIRANLALHPRLAVAGAYNYSTFDGSFDNAHPLADLSFDRGTNGNSGGHENQSFSASIVANPIDPLTIEFSYNRFDVEEEARAGQNLFQANGDLNCGGMAGFGVLNSRLLCGEFAEPPEDAVTDPRSFGVHSETDIFRVGATYEFSDALQVSYIFGAVDGDVRSAGSSEPDQLNCGLVGPSCAFTATPNGGVDYTSHELRAVYDDGETWRFELGGFYSDGEDDFRTIQLTLPVIAGVTDTSTIQSANSLLEPIGDPASGDITDSEIQAIFGAFQWTSPSSRLRLGAELRYSETEISSATAVSFAQPVPIDLNETFDVFTPRITAEYDVTDSSLVYATVAKGAKSGGFNTRAIGESLLSFDEETNWTYEIGAKNQFFDNRLVLNVAAFYTDWSDLQVSVVDPENPSQFSSAVTDNLGDARVFGFEVEASFYVTENFSLDGTFSYTDAEYASGTVDERFSQLAPFAFGDTSTASCDDVVCPLSGDIGGNEIDRTPSTQISFGAQWEDELPFWNDASYYLRSDLSWQDDFFVTPVNIATIPDRFLLGASAGLLVGNVDINLWARNLTDENFVSNSFFIVAPFGNAYNAFFGDRRTFGATVKVDF